ncbi:MAG: hypothetical protein ABW321_16455, partial [Polyangiales bacterium]
ALCALRDPETGAPVVRHVHARDELFSGPHLERAPDLLLELALDRGYSYNLMPSPAANGGTFRRLSPDEYLGRKGRSLPGSHRNRGLFIASGPTIQSHGELDVAMADVSAILLARMHIALPPPLEGQIPDALVQAPAPPPSATTPTDLEPLPEPTWSAADYARVEERLRRLGYIE